MLLGLAVHAVPAWAQAPEADVFVARAVVAYDERRYEDALAALEQAFALFPGHLDALYYKGLALFGLMRMEEALAAFGQVLQAQPDDDATLFQVGLVELARGNYDAAERPLERAFAINPAREGAGYYVGMLRYRKRDYARAVQAFRRNVTTDKEIQTLARFYTGLALSGLGQPEELGAELDEAMRIQPASPLTGAAERLRQSIVGARERDRRFRAEVRVGMVYDDNVPAIPDESSDTFIQELRRAPRSSVGEVAAVRFDYSLLRRPSFETTVTYSFLTAYSNELPRFNLVSHLGNVTTTYRTALAGLPVYASLPYTYDYITLGGDSFIQRHIVAPWLGIAASNAHFTTLQAHYMNKDFFEEPEVAADDKRDAANWLIGISHLFRLARDQYLFRIGYQWDTDETRGRNVRYDGHRVLAGAQYTLPWGGVRLNYDFDVHLRDYRHAHSSLPTTAPGTRQRFDTEFTHVMRATVPLPRDFAVVVQYQASRVQSNLELFSYDRNIVSVLLVWTY